MNTAVIVVFVIISLIAAASVFLALKYKHKSTEITPSAEKSKSGEQIGPGMKKMKTKHSSSTTGVDEASGEVRRKEGQGGERKKRRRKRPNSNPNVQADAGFNM